MKAIAFKYMGQVAYSEEYILYNNFFKIKNIRKYGNAVAYLNIATESLKNISISNVFHCINILF